MWVAVDSERKAVCPPGVPVGSQDAPHCWTAGRDGLIFLPEELEGLSRAQGPAPASRMQPWGAVCSG